MATRRSFVTASRVLVGLLLGVATLSASSSKLEYLTFSGPVALPGVTLYAGTYSFEILDYMSSPDVVSIHDKGTRRPVFLGMTQRVERPAGAKKESSVVLGESPRGVPPPIVTWFPKGDSRGYQFIYPIR